MEGRLCRRPGAHHHRGRGLWLEGAERCEEVGELSPAVALGVFPSSLLTGGCFHWRFWQKSVIRSPELKVCHSSWRNPARPGSRKIKKQINSEININTLYAVASGKPADSIQHAAFKHILCRNEMQKVHYCDSKSKFPLRVFNIWWESSKYKPRSVSFTMLSSCLQINIT